MFARKDLEHDVLSAYQKYSRSLRKANAGSSEAPRPRTISFLHENAQASVDSKVNTSSVPVRNDLETNFVRQSPTSDIDSAYTYSPTETPTKEGRSEDKDAVEKEHERCEEARSRKEDHEDEAVAGVTEAQT